MDRYALKPILFLCNELTVFHAEEETKIFHRDMGKDNDAGNDDEDEKPRKKEEKKKRPEVDQRKEEKDVRPSC